MEFAIERRRWSPLGAGLIVLFLSGCEAKPRAPALTDDPVYQNDQYGLRLLAPERWKQIANAVVPPGQHDKPMQIVGYQSPQMDAAFEIFVAEVPGSIDLQSLAIQPSHGVAEWKSAGAAEPMTVGNVPAMRYRFRGLLGTVSQTKDVVAVRRGDRVFLFILLAAARDTVAVDAARLSIGSVTWRD